MPELKRELAEVMAEGFRRNYDQLRPVGDSFLRIVAYVANHTPWEAGTQFQILSTAHMVRLFHRMGVRLSDRWSLAKASSVTPSQQEGNLYRACKEILQRAYPSGGAWSKWGSDLWDDCYVLLALLEVEDELRDLANKEGHSNLFADYEGRKQTSVRWLKDQVTDGFRNIPDSEWKGPGFCAALIELFHALGERRQSSVAEKVIARTVNIAGDLINGLRATRAAPPWNGYFGWHAGQMIATWKKLRDQHVALKNLDDVFARLYKELVSAKRQQRSGAWENDDRIRDEERAVYNTTRALWACYVMEEEPWKSPAVTRAHQFLLRLGEADPPLRSIKGCLNAMEAYLELFDFKLSSVRLFPLIELDQRLTRLGLANALLTSRASPQNTLHAVRGAARRALEDRGICIQEPLGVNARLLDDLGSRPSFLSQFSGDPVATRDKLRELLGSPMNEVRSATARGLIRDLWTRDGFLDFLPFLKRLSALEFTRAYYSRYRDHVNHQLLFWLLGCYVYYNSPRIREAIDGELTGMHEQLALALPSSLEEEFLFRWKLIATFHDVGYIFEVGPDTGSAAENQRRKLKLLKESFSLVDGFRKDFLRDHMLELRGADAAAVQAWLAAEGTAIPEYKPRIKDWKGFVPILTRGTTTTDAFATMAQELTRLNMYSDLLRGYFDLCRTQSTERRPPFLDHGIMSALLLLKIADIQWYYLTQLQSIALGGGLRSHPAIRNVLLDKRTRKHLQAEQFYVRFPHVAVAIGLHNVSPRLYSKEEYRAQSEPLACAFYGAAGGRGRYGIGLNRAPLAFLTAIVDVLQDWDRHSFEEPEFPTDAVGTGRRGIAANEVLITAGEEGIRVRPLSEEAERRYRKSFSALEDYLIDWRKILILEKRRM